MSFLRGLLIAGVLSLAVIVEATPVNKQPGEHLKKNDCVPAFLVNATEEVRKQFKAIDEQSLNWTEQEAAFDALAAEQDSDIQAAYQQYKADFKTKYDALSSDAKSALETFGTIKVDASLSSKEKKEQEISEWMKLNEDMRNQIIDLIQLRGNCGGLEGDSMEQDV